MVSATDIAQRPSPSTDAGRETPERTTAQRDSVGGRRLDLDVVRGLAILLALGWHFSRRPSGNLVVDALQWPGRFFGWAGVDLFFVLSGFLVGSLVLREHKKTGRFRGGRFTLRRALKLWPVLYVFLAVQALFGSEPLGSYLWQNAIHVQNYAGTSLVHLWSLAVEEHFYLALVLLFPLFARSRRSPRVLLGVLGSILVAALALRIVATAQGLDPVLIQWRTHFRADSLAFGVLLAVLAVHYPAVFDRLQTHRRALAGVLVVGVAFLATIGKSGPLGTTLGFTVAYLTGAALLLLVYRARWVPRAGFVSRPMAALGRYSYGIYIWHIVAAQFVLGLLPGVQYHSWTPLEQALKYGSAIALGILATVLVERPVLRLRDRLVPAGARADAPVSGWGADPRHSYRPEPPPPMRLDLAMGLR